MKWSKIDVDNVFRWRKKINKIVILLIFIYCGIMMIVVAFTPIGNNIGGVSEFTIIAIVFFPVATIAIAGILVEIILQKIAYKACEVQMEVEVLKTLWSETLQRIALNEQAAEGGYPDDEYLEQFMF